VKRTLPGLAKTARDFGNRIRQSESSVFRAEEAKECDKSSKTLCFNPEEASGFLLNSFLFRNCEQRALLHQRRHEYPNAVRKSPLRP
jgi:hypothetical protein